MGIVSEAKGDVFMPASLFYTGFVPRGVGSVAVINPGYPTEPIGCAEIYSRCVPEIDSEVYRAEINKGRFVPVIPAAELSSRWADADYIHFVVFPEQVRREIAEKVKRRLA